MCIKQANTGHLPNAETALGGCPVFAGKDYLVVSGIPEQEKTYTMTTIRQSSHVYVVPPIDKPRNPSSPNLQTQYSI